MSKKILSTLKQDSSSSCFSTPKTPLKKVVYRDMIESSILDINIPSDDILEEEYLIPDNKIGEGDFFTVYKYIKEKEEGDDKDKEDKEEGDDKDKEEGDSFVALKKSNNPIKNTLEYDFYNKEVSFLKSINSEYVTKFYKSFTYKSHFYIEIEYCEGGTLRDYLNINTINKDTINKDTIHKDTMNKDTINKDTINKDTIHKIIREVATGLRDIHNQGIVHLDIKPENIFIRKGQFKIGDLGISLRIGEDIRLDGDKRYMGPEVLRNICTTSSDIFSLGLIYLEMKGNINLPLKGDPWLRLRKNNFKGIDMDSISRKMLCSNYKKRCSIEEVLRYFRK